MRGKETWGLVGGGLDDSSSLRVRVGGERESERLVRFVERPSCLLLVGGTMAKVLELIPYLEVKRAGF
jgi:hypothetical protein